MAHSCRRTDSAKLICVCVIDGCRMLRAGHTADRRHGVQSTLCAQDMPCKVTNPELCRLLDGHPEMQHITTLRVPERSEHLVKIHAGDQRLKQARCGQPADGRRTPLRTCRTSGIWRACQGWTAGYWCPSPVTANDDKSTDTEDRPTDIFKPAGNSNKSGLVFFLQRT